MAKINKIPVRLFRAAVYIFLGNREDLLQWATINKEYFPGLVELVQDDDLADADAVTYHTEGVNIVLMDKFPKTILEYANLNHELLHCVFNILNRVEVEYDSTGHNETFTYLMSYLTEEAYDKSYYEEVKYEKVE